MKISGDLEDARIAEVIQVIHLGGRSGTLQVESDGRRAEIGFLRGRMVRAAATGGPRLGDVVVEEQIQATVFEVVGWRRGSFEFDVDQLPPTPEVTSGDRGDMAVGRVRRVLADLRSGLFSATVSLSLMNIVAESAERALLFLVRRHDLLALGAFGFAPPEGRPLAEATRGLHIPLALGGALRLATTEGRLRTVPFAAEHLPAELMRRIGCPRYRHGTIVPVSGREEVVVVIYADNGAIDAPVADLDLLEVAAAQVGFAFENELLRRAVTRAGRNEPSREAAW